MKLVKQFIRQNLSLVLGTLFLLLIQLTATLYIPYLVAHIVDDGILANNLNTIYSLGLEMLFVAIIGVIAAVACSYYSSVIATRFGTDLRLQVFKKVQVLSVKDVEDYGTSSLVSRITSDVVDIQQVVVMLFQMILPGPLIGIVCVIMSYMISPTLGLVALMSILVFLGAAIIVTKRAVPYMNAIQYYLDRMILVLREFFIGVRIIRAFDNSEYEQKRTDKTFEDHAENMIKINRLFAYLSPIAYALLGVSMVAILWFGLIDVPSGTLQLGEVTAVIEYTTLTILTLIMAALVIVMIPRALAALQRVDTLIAIEPSVQDITTAHKLSHASDDIVRFEHVFFGYEGEDGDALVDVSFYIPKGQTTAIIGATGSGKSTIAKLIMRFHDTTNGRVMFQDTDIRDLSQHDLRDSISYIPQKSFLFSGTVQENIKFHKPNGSNEAMRQAARTAQAAPFIESLDASYHSEVVRGGMNFSGGQKQRISIARALYKDADLYVFDDSFSALDYKTDAILRQALKKDMPEATYLIIAQRVSTIMNADQIIVMDQGHIVGIGTHTSLMQTSPVYRQFAESQHIFDEQEETDHV